MRAVTKGLWSSATLWRYVDAFAPRVFGLVVHTFLVLRHGMDAYALPTWCLGVFGLALAFIPDPHAFILVRRSGAAARRLLSLTTPWVVLKVAAAGIICGSSVTFAAADTLLAPHQGSVVVIVLSSVVFGAVEAAWAVLGTAALAIGNVRRVAITGVVARSISAALLIGAAARGPGPLCVDLVIASIPTTVALASLLPASWRASRLVPFMWVATKRYGIWSQGLAILTGTLLQAPALVLGVVPMASATGVGQLSYMTRLIGAALAPIQILQSVVIRELAIGKGRVDARLAHMRRVMRVGAVGIGLVGLGGLGAIEQKGAFEPGIASLSTLLVSGVAVSCWYRFELSTQLATSRIRELFLYGYVPVLAVALVIGAGLVPVLGMTGLGVAIAVAWIGTALSWKWTQNVSLSKS
jgi:hypothetical protein